MSKQNQMMRREFLKASAMLGGGFITASSAITGVRAQEFNSTNNNKPFRIVMGGYGPPTSSFSQGLKRIGDRLEASFSGDVEVKYVYNIMDLGYDGSGGLATLVDNGWLSLAYMTMFAGIPALELAALPFLFTDTATARAAMDGALGQSAIETIEQDTNYRVLGFFENGFRHVSNNTRPVKSPDDLAGLAIRVLTVQARTFELLGAKPTNTPLPGVFKGLESGQLDGQENPFENVVTYSLYKAQRYYTETYHSYLSRPIFVNRASFDSWPAELQAELRVAVQDAVSLQRGLHDEAEISAAETIRESGGEIIQLTPAQRQKFVDAVAPIYVDAQSLYSRDLLDSVGL